MIRRELPATTHRSTVDMIIAVHDLRRNIKRAIGSVLADEDPTIRAFIVAHNLARTEVESAIAELADRYPGRIRVEELLDGVRSPSGPFTFGIAASDADYVGIMGSDDELDPAAIRQWRERAIALDADAVIAKVVRGSQRTLVRSPPKRLWRVGRLDFVKDRLSYRSAPLGLIRRSAVARLDLELLPGARNGGDLPFVTKLWLSGRVVAATGAAAYIEHADAPERVTYVAKPVAEELNPITLLLVDPITRTMTSSQRHALATKLFRRNLTDSVRKRGSGLLLTAEDCATLRTLAAAITELAPNALNMLSIAQRRMFDELARTEPDPELVVQADAASLRYRTLPALLPAKLKFLLHSQAQPRFMIATSLIKIGASRFFPPNYFSVRRAARRR